MSIENFFNKLEEKLTYLIRNLGLVITILFGFTATVYSFIGINPFIIIITLALLFCFLYNLLYSLYIYIYKSSGIREEIYEITLYEELLTLTRSITYLSSFALKNLLEIYLEMFDLSVNSKSKLHEKVLETFERYGYNFEKYKIITFTTDVIYKVQRIISIFLEILGLMIINISEYEKNINLGDIRQHRSVQEKINRWKETLLSYSEKLNDYNSKLIKYKELTIYDCAISFTQFENPMTILSEYLVNYVNHLESTYEIILTNNKMNKENYEKKIKNSYKIYGITITSTLIIFLIIIIVILILTDINPK